jgi:MFS family permease
LNKVSFPFYALAFLSGVVWMAIVPLAPIYAHAFSLSKVETGTILAVAGVATLAISLPIGVLADRVGTRTLTIGVSVLIVLSCLGQGLAVNFWSLLLSRAAFGLALGTIWTAGIAWISNTSSEHQRSSALGVPTLVSGVGIMLGPGFAGLLASGFGVRVPFLVLAGAAALVTVALLRESGPETAYRHEPLLQTLRGAYAAALLLVITGTSAAAIIAFLLLRAPFWSTLSTLSYPLGAIGAHRADLGRGTIMGLLNVVWGAASSLGPVVAGGIAQGAGDRWPYGALFLWCAATGLWLLSGKRPARHAG